MLHEAADIFTAQIQNTVPSSVAGLKRAAQRPHKADQMINIEVAITTTESKLITTTDESYSLSILLFCVMQPMIQSMLSQT